MAALEPIARTLKNVFAATMLTVAASDCVPDTGPADTGDAMATAQGCVRDFSSDTLCPRAQPKFYFCSPPATPGTTEQCVVHRDRMGVYSEWCCTARTP